MNKILWPILIALALTGCSSTATKPAAVESRTAAPATTAAPPAATTATPSGAVGGQPIAATPAPVDPRKDPSNPLFQRSVYFDFDKFEVKDQYRPMLEAHAGYLRANPNARVILQGNTDERGSREYNLALGQKRAEAVRRVLNVMGVPDGQMEAISFGEEKLRNPGTTEDAHAENRRTDIVYGDE
ncbi:MAG: peptidoglycan-associated lipoprotein Pal [Thiobacillus sp.]